MPIFGRELIFHPHFKHVKFRIFVPILTAYYLTFGLFGFYGGGEYLRSRYFRRTLNRYKFDFDSVLDAGCGYGYYSFYLARKYPNAIIDACDFDADIINENKYILSQLKLKNLNFFQEDLTELSKHNKYDVIFSIDVLEAIENDVKVIKNIRNALKKGGHFLLHTPKKNQQDTNNNWKEERPERVREGYTRDKISQLLESNGFEIIEKIKTFGTFGMIGNKIDSLLPTRLLKLILSIPLNCINFLDTLTKNKKGQAFLVIAKKR